MNRQFYLDLAARGATFPIGTELVLREHPDAEAIVRDGARMAGVIVDAARRYHSPLAIPVMDLTTEKAVMLSILGIPPVQVDTYHFDAVPTDEMVRELDRGLSCGPVGRIAVQAEAIRRVTAEAPELVPVGMTIGPFSLMTKLVADPITPVYLAGTGVTAGDDEEVRRVERALQMSLRVVLHSVRHQVDAGARAVFIAEPAANKAYFSPNQLTESTAVFDRYVMDANRQVKALLESRGVELIFHCCGELVDVIVSKFDTLDPAILSLGSSRKLWEDARLVSKRTVLYGNLPTKKFYSDDSITEDQVRRQAAELVQRMHAVRHPFILGSECDVLSVPGCEETIRRKVEAMIEACKGYGCERGHG